MTTPAHPPLSFRSLRECNAYLRGLVKCRQTGRISDLEYRAARAALLDQIGRSPLWSRLVDDAPTLGAGDDRGRQTVGSGRPVRGEEKGGTWTTGLSVVLLAGFVLLVLFLMGAFQL